MLPALRWVYSQKAGTDHLDLATFRSRRIMVSNSGQLNSRPVAEMALASMVVQAKGLPMHFAMQRRRLQIMMTECNQAVRAAISTLETASGIPYTVHLLHVRLREI